MYLPREHFTTHSSLVILFGKIFYATDYIHVYVHNAEILTALAKKCFCDTKVVELGENFTYNVFQP